MSYTNLLDMLNVLEYANKMLPQIQNNAGGDLAQHKSINDHD